MTGAGQQASGVAAGHGAGRRWRLAAASVAVAVGVVGSTVGVLATPVQATPRRTTAPAKTTPPAAGPGITATATGRVSAKAPLPGGGEGQAATLVPGSVRVSPDRSAFRTIEPLSTPLDTSKAVAALGASSEFNVQTVRAADANGDGTDDLVTAVGLYVGGRYRSYLTVMLGIGDGTYTDPIFSLGAPADGPNGTTPYDLALADVDGDGNLDAIMSSTDYQTGVLSLLLGVGDGSFGAPIGTQAIANPGYIRLGSWGGTADVQAAITGANATIHVVDVTAEGFDDLTPAGVPWLSSNYQLNAIEAADVDQDGQSELYLAMNSGLTDAEGVQRLTDLTDPSPSKTWVEGVKPGVQRLAIADVDADGHLDLLVTERRPVGFSNQWWMRAVALPGRSPSADAFGTGTKLDYTEGNCPERAEAGRPQMTDVDHDGNLDAVMQSCQWGQINNLRVALGDGTGGFTLSQWVATPGENGKDPVAGLNRQPRGIAVIDANGDDLPDIAWSGTSDGVANGVTVVLGNIGHRGELVAPPMLDAGGLLGRDQSWNAQQVRIADWDEDGTPDLVILRDNDIAWRKGDGTGRFGPPAVISVRTSSTWCAAGAGELGVFDLDGDGHQDLVCHTPGKLGMAWGAGEGVDVVGTPLIDVPNYQNWNGYHGIDAPDLDGNGKLDLVIPVFSSSFDVGSIGYVFLQGASRAWPASPVELAMGTASTLAVGNVDSDPDPELVALPDRRRQGTDTAELFDRVISWSADDAGGMSEHIGSTAVSRVVGGLGGTVDNGHGLGDFDGDGILDLVTVWYYGNPYYQQRLLVRKGLGGGEFAAQGDAYQTSMNWVGNGYQRGGSSIGVRDMDGDGNLDLVYESSSFGVEILPGNGDGTFDDTRFGRWPAGNNNGSIAIGDVDGDRKPDVIAGTNNEFADGPQFTHVLLLNRSVPNSDAQPDLAVTNVSAPTSVGAGDEVAVDVTVTNVGGDIRAATRWKDGAWLSETAGYSLDATEIDVREHAGPLAAGASYTVTLTGPAQAFRGGGHVIVARTDLAKQVTEPNEADNTADRLVDVAVPTLTPGGDPVHVTVAQGASRLVRIPAAAGRTVSLTATPATASSVRARAGADRAPRLGQGVQLRPTGTGPLVGSLSRGSDGDLYAVVEGLSAAGTGTDVALVASDAAVGLFTASPGRVSNGGDVTLTVTGAGLDDAAMQLQPRSGASGGAVDATTVRRGDADGTWFATFALTDQLGSFDLKASGPGGDALLPAAVVVESPVVTPNAREFEVSASVPARIRRHVRGPGGVEIRPGYSGRVTIRNRTGRDLPAPFIRIEGTGLEVTWPDVAAGKRTVAADAQPGTVGVLTLLGTVPGGPVDTIPARATITVDFRLFATAETDFAIDVGLWAASDQSGELDYGPEAAAVASATGLPGTAATAIEAALRQATTHPTRPTYAGASADGPWPTPGGYTRALDRMARTMDDAGRRVGSVEELRSLVVDAALASADVGAPISGSVVQGGGTPDEPLGMWAAPKDGTGPILTGSAAPDGSFNLLPSAGDDQVSAEDYQVFVDGRIESPAATVAVSPGTPATGVEVDVAVGGVARGRITRSADGSPVAGAQVALVPIAIAGAPSVAAETGLDGRFRATGLKDGTYRVSIRAAGLATLADEQVSVAGATTTIDRALAAGNDVSGTVTGPGAPGAKVTAYRSISPGALTAVAVATVGSDGTYRLSDLPAVAATLVARTTAGATASTDVTVSGDTTEDLVLAAAVDASGTVTSGRSGAVVAGATVQLLTGVAGEPPRMATTGADGTFTIAEVPPVAALVVASATGEGSTAAVGVDLASAPTGIELQLTSGHRITGTVTDAAGDPVVGAVVDATAPAPRDAGEGNQTWDGSRSATGADGRYELTVPVGSYAVSVLGASADATVAAGQPDPVVDLTVSAAPVTGRVVDGGGDPVGDVLVHLTTVDGDVATTTSAADGTFRSVVRSGVTISAWVALDGWGIAHAAGAVPASGSLALGDLAPGSSSLTADLTADAVPSAGEVQVVPVLGGTPASFGMVAPVDSTGHVVVAGLEEGSYRVSATGPGRGTLVIDAILPAAGPLDVALPIGVAFSATITDPDGAPVASAQVDLRPEAGGGGASAITADDGSVAFTDVAPGTYDLWVAPLRRASVRVASGIVLAAPSAAPAAVPAAAPTGGLVARASAVPAPSAAPASYTYTDTPGVLTKQLYGKIVGPNGTGMGPEAPQVTARSHGGDPIPVEVRPDGSFAVVDPPDGPLVIQVAKEGHETKTYGYTMPDDSGKQITLEVGLPTDKKDQLSVDVDPPSPLPSVAEAFAALFDLVDPEPRAVDPFMFTILSANPAHNPCPNGNALLEKAKRAAHLAQVQTEIANQLLEERYAEKWRRGWLFTVQMLDTVGSLISAALPVAKALKSGVYVVTETAKAVGDAAPGLLELLDQVRDVPITSMVQNLTQFITSAIIGGSVDLDAATFGFISTMDLVRYALEQQRILLLTPATKALIPLRATLLRATGIALAAFLDVVYAFYKAKDAVDQLKAEFQAVKDLEVSATQASDLANKLENQAKRLYSIWLSQSHARTDCDQPKELPGYAGGVGGAVDPNEIEGPTGAGADRWLAVPAGLGYEVHFENLGPGTVNPPAGVPLATSPAAQVVVRETVPATYDRSSFTFDDLGWGTHVIDVADGVQSFSVDEPITVPVDGEDVPLVVRVTGDYDPATGQAVWTYRTLDPETGQIPLDPAEGFLPPEPGDETGQGWARYSVSGAPDVAVGTFLDATASITFDTNDPIDTNTWRNRVGTPGSVGDVCPADDTDAGRFLCAVYPDVVGRQPDTAGKAFWLGRLTAGTSRPGLAYQLLSSIEARRTAVRQIFDQYLDRSPDPDGLAFWVRRMQRGATRDTVRQTVLGSSEYLRRHGGTRAGFVDGLYEDVYGRSADAPGKAHWVAALAAGRSRSSLAGRFLAAREGRRAIVRDAYDDYLRRSLSYAEADYWALRLLRTRDEKRFRAEVLGSAEYLRKAGAA